MFYGGGLLVLILDIITIYFIVKSGGDPAKMLLWILLVLFLPIVGPILYFLLGPGSSKI